MLSRRRARDRGQDRARFAGDHHIAAVGSRPAMGGSLMFSRIALRQSVFGLSLSVALILLSYGRFGSKEGSMTPHSCWKPEPVSPVQTSPPPSDSPAEATVKRTGADQNWFRLVSARIDLEEYNATVNSRGLQAPNREHNLRTYFGNGGIKVVPRVGEGSDPWTFTWHTMGWGRLDPSTRVATGVAEPTPKGAQVTYAWGEMVERYVNSKEGVEQTFSVPKRLPGDGPFRVEGAIGGSLRPELRPDAKGIDLLDPNGMRRLRYAELLVKDAGDHVVPSRFELCGNRIALLIDDRSASYPITIDPLLTTPSWTAESNQANAHFGYSVATAGDVNGDGYSDVIVGAPGYDDGQVDQGRAYVYTGSASGLSTNPSWVVAGSQGGAQFGCSVGTAGDVNGDGYSDVIVGADHGGTDGTG